MPCVCRHSNSKQRDKIRRPVIFISFHVVPREIGSAQVVENEGMLDFVSVPRGTKRFLIISQRHGTPLPSHSKSNV